MDDRLSRLYERALQVYAESLESSDEKLAFAAAKDVLGMAKPHFDDVGGVTEIRIVLDAEPACES